MEALIPYLVKISEEGILVSDDYQNEYYVLDSIVTTNRCVFVGDAYLNALMWASICRGYSPSRLIIRHTEQELFINEFTPAHVFQFQSVCGFLENMIFTAFISDEGDITEYEIWVSNVNQDFDLEYDDIMFPRNSQCRLRFSKNRFDSLVKECGFTFIISGSWVSRTVGPEHE